MTSLMDENIRRINAHLERIEGVLKTLTAAVGSVAQVLSEVGLVEASLWSELIAERERQIEGLLMEELIEGYFEAPQEEGGEEDGVS